MLEDETPSALLDDSSRAARSCFWPSASAFLQKDARPATHHLSASAWFQLAGLADTPTAPVVAEEAAPPSAGALRSRCRTELIQQARSATALLYVLDQHSDSLDHREVAAAVVRLLELIGGEDAAEETVDQEANNALQRLHMLLHKPVASASASAPPAATRLACLRAPELSLLLHALSTAARKGRDGGGAADAERLLVGDLLRQLLSDGGSAGAAASAATSEVSGYLGVGRDILHEATPGELSLIAQAVSRLAGRLESTTPSSESDPEALQHRHHSQCTLGVRGAFSAVITAAHWQLQACASSPASCRWDVEGLAALASAMARLDHYDEKLMASVALAAKSPGLMAEAPPASVVLLLSAFSRLRHDAPDLFRHAALQLRSCMHKLRAKDVAVAINAFESRHVSGTRWRNKPLADLEATAGGGGTLRAAVSALAAAAVGLPLPQAVSRYSQHACTPADRDEARSVGGAMAAYDVPFAVAAADGTAESPHQPPHCDCHYTAPHPSTWATHEAGLASGGGGNASPLGGVGGGGGGGLRSPAPKVKPMLRMDTKIEPWDLMAGGVRKMYLWHLLDVSAAASQ